MLPSKTAVNTVNDGAGRSLAACSAQPLWTSASILTLALLAAAAGVLRFAFLVRKPFWFDECFSVEVARLGWHDLGRLLWRREANMSLYYLLLRGWLHFGFSPFFIRSFSVIISLAGLPAVYWLAGKLFDRRVALLAAALMSFNAYHIRYAQEARSYSLFVLLATLSSGFFVALLQKPSRPNLVGYILASVLGVYAHLYGLLLVAAHGLSARGFDRTPERICFHTLRRARIWIGFASLPLVIFAAKTGAGPIRWIQRPRLHDLVDFAEHMSGNDGLILALLYATACVAAIMPLEKAMRMFRTDIDWDVWRLRFLLIWIIFPVALVVLLSLARPIFLGRYFIFCLPALVILAAAGMARRGRPWLMALSLAAILALSLQGTFSYYDHDFDLERDASEAAVNYILDRAQPGDAILFHIAEARLPYEFFKAIRFSHGGASGPEIIYPRHADHLDYRDFTGKPSGEFLHSVPAHYPRVWVVLMSNGTPGQPDGTTQSLNQTLGDCFPHVEGAKFAQVEVRLYSSP